MNYNMKLAVAQTQPIKGNIAENLKNHCKMIEVAVSKGANVLIFPELSLTGYEPELSKDLATNADDIRLEPLQRLSNNHGTVIGVGLPLNTEGGITISMVLFHPYKPRQVYGKKYLHSTETPFFVSAQNGETFIKDTKIALAICYELSVAEHAEVAYKKGAEIYIASVVEDTIDKALVKLSNTAQKYAMTVLMANCVGQTGSYMCDGKSSIINKKGEILGQLDTENEGLLIWDETTVSIETIDFSIEVL
jgi:predicted amidohydrolase